MSLVAASDGLGTAPNRLTYPSQAMASSPERSLGTHEGNSTAQSDPIETHFIRMLTASWVSRALYTAAKLEVADAMHSLGGSGISVRSLSKVVGAHPSALRRLLRALASVGVFRTEGEPHGWCFSLTPLADLLRTDAPGSLRHAVIMYGEEMAQCWGELPAVVQSERPAWSRVFRVDHFAYYQDNPHAAKVFDRAMRELGRSIYDDNALASSFDFGQTLGDTPNIVDVGGGLGSFLVAILRQTPGAQGILYDRPHVIQRAKEQHAQLDASESRTRLSFATGDFFEWVPPGADAYVLKRVLHDWDDDRCCTILRAISDAMAPKGRVLVVETVLPTGDDDHFGKWLDLNMMVVTGGLERTEQEFARLFERAGLALVQSHASPTLLRILEAKRIA